MKTDNAFRCMAVIGIFCASIFMAGCQPQTVASAPSGARAPEVAYVTVASQAVVLTTELPGRTSSYRVAEIRPQINGLIQKRLFTEGSDVHAGQVLYQIDPAPFQAAVDNAAASLAAAKKAADQARAALDTSIAKATQQRAILVLAETNRRRFEGLFQEKAVSESQRDQTATDADVAVATLRAAEAQVKSYQEAMAVAEATILQSEAALKIARINLDYTRITAAISGRIGKSSATEGAIVTAYQPVALATIQQLDPIYVDVPQSTTELLRLQDRLKEGRISRNGSNLNKVQLVLENGAMYPLEGTLQFRDVSVDASTGSVVLRMIFPNPDKMLLPGMFVRTEVKEGVNAHAILIPQQAVARDPKGNPTALIVDTSGKVQQRMLTLDHRAMGNQWLVVSGLSPGERLIVEGMQRVRPGATVKAVPFDQDPENLPESERAVRQRS